MRNKPFDFENSGFKDVLRSLEADKKEPEERIVPYQASLKIAHDLLSKHGDQIIDAEYELDPYREGIRKYLGEVPDEILEHYQGHGVTRNSDEEQVAALLNIMANHSIKGMCGPLVGGAGYGAYKSGSFLIASHYDKDLVLEGQPQFSQAGWKADIGVVIVRQRFYPIVEELQKRFPGENILRADQCPEFFLSRK